MSGPDLFREHLRNEADTRADAALQRHGVPASVTPLCGLNFIEQHGRFYEPVTGGRPAIIVPVLDGGELADLLAFDPRRSGQWFVRLGSVPLLGADALADQLVGQRLHVYRTPLSWLQHGCDGIVPLDFNRAAIDLVTAQYGIVAEDDAHVGELQRAMIEAAQWRLPDIFLRQGEAAQ